MAYFVTHFVAMATMVGRT